jgi:hypothetical protein
MKKLFLGFLTMTLLTLSTCSDNPITDDTLQPGRRDYIWTIDTLKIPEGRSYPTWMWGTNANNVWAIGSGYLNAYQIWHYDGIIGKTMFQINILTHAVFVVLAKTIFGLGALEQVACQQHFGIITARNGQSFVIYPWKDTIML